MAIKYKVNVEIELEYSDEIDANNPNWGVNVIANTYANMATCYKTIGAESSKVVSIERIFAAGDEVSLCESMCKEMKLNHLYGKIIGIDNIKEYNYITVKWENGDVIGMYPSEISLRK